MLLDFQMRMGQRLVLSVPIYMIEEELKSFSDVLRFALELLQLVALQTLH